MKNVSKILLSASLLTLVACGNNSNSSNKKTTNPLTEPGHFKAELESLNNHIAGDVSGDVMVKVRGDSIQVEVKVNGAPSQVMHAQAIHSSDACPTLSSDVNKDGIIDGVEAQKSYGPMLIPLDNDLKTQLDGTAYPVADFSGNYFYRQNVVINDLLKDLTAVDNDPKDYVTKLGKSNLSFSGRQVVIYGVAEDAALPETVSAANGNSKQASLPIACGTFVKVAIEEEESNSNGVKY